MSVWDKLQDNNRPHKLLALDGGGMRGVITIEILAAIEQHLQHALGRDASFVLADYFDYIAGTSTGAILATCLALGWRSSGSASFITQRQGDVRSCQHLPALPHESLTLSRWPHCCNRKVGPGTTRVASKLKTLLLLILRNATTDSPWPLSNNPYAK